MKSYYISRKHWSSVNTPHGPLIRFKINTNIATRRKIATPTITRQATQHRTPIDQVVTQKTGPQGKPKFGHIVIPYIQGLGDSFMKTCGKYGIQTHFTGNSTIKHLLFKPKDQDPKEKKSCVIYSYQCGEIACDEKNIGETSRTLGERCHEHLKEPSLFHVHSLQSGHNATQEDFNIIGREDQGLTRTIKESIYIRNNIRINNPTLNRNIGKFNLYHTWDRVLLNTLDLKINSPNGYVHIHNSGHAQSIPTNGHLQITIGHSGHALNSKHACRSS